MAARNHTGVLVSSREFRFLDPGPLVDQELELVHPQECWIEGLLKAASHPLTRQISPRDASLTGDLLQRYVRDCPLGRQQADPDKNVVPAYSFWMRLRPQYDPPVPMAGGITLRIGQNENLQRYLGHVGYSVYPPARGRHYAERAVRLLLGLARRHGVDPLWITCNPDNLASRRTCERLGGIMVEIVALPRSHPLYERGDREKCRYRIELDRVPPATAEGSS